MALSFLLKGEHRLFLRLCGLVFVLGFFGWSVPHASATARTWDGEGSDNNWSTCANWTGDTCPVGVDTLTFDSTSTKDSTIDGPAADSITSLTIASTYSGTITLSQNFLITNGLAQNAGTFTMSGSNTLTVRGAAFNIVGGTFNHGSGTLTVGTTTCGTSEFKVTGGTFNGGSGDLDINHTCGGFIVSSGTFVAPTGTAYVPSDLSFSGGTFTHNSGTFKFDTGGDDSIITGSPTFNNVTVEKTSNMDFKVGDGSDTITVVGTFTFIDGQINGSGSTDTLALQGAVDIQAGYDGMASSNAFGITFSGSSTLTVNLPAVAFSPATLTVNNTNLTLNGPNSGTLTFGKTLVQAGTFNTGNGDTTLNRGLYISGGTMAHGSGTLTISDGSCSGDRDFSMTGGTFTGGSGVIDWNGSCGGHTFDMASGATFTSTSGEFRVGFDVAITGGTFNHNNGTVVFDGGSTTVNVPVGGITFYDLTFNASATESMSSDTYTIERNLSVTSATINSATFTFSGATNGTITLSAAGLFNGDMNINKSTTSSVQLLSAMTFDASNQDLKLQEGIFDINGFDLVVNGTSATLPVEDGGTLRLQGGETITANSGYPSLAAGSRVTYAGTAGPYTLKDYTYHDLKINGSGATFSMGANEVLGGNLTVTAGTFDVNDNTLTINGNTTINGGVLKSGTNTVTFGDAGADSVTISGGSFEIESDASDTDIVKTANTWTNSGGTIIYNAATTVDTVLLSALAPYNHLTLNSSGSTYTLNGITDVNGTVTLTAGTLDVSGSNHGITVGGGWTDTGGGAFTERIGTVTFDGTGTLNSNEAFNNVTVNSAGTITLGAALDVDNNLTLTAGTLDVSSGNNYGITVGRNWANTGTFTARGGTVTFDDAGKISTLSGSTTFYNFTCTTAAKALTFTASTTQTIGNALTLTGTSGNLVRLRSSSVGTRWNLPVNGSVNVSFVDVKDSDASAGSVKIAAGNSTNSGNNVYWYTTAPTVASVTALQAINGSGDVTLSFVLDDADDNDTLQVKIEYSLNGGSTWNDPTISTTNSETTATFGDPSVNNAQTYQVGQSGAYILTSSGENTVTTIWEAATDIPNTTDISNARIRVTPYDGVVEGTAGSSASFVLDVVAPTVPGSLAKSGGTGTTAVFTWTASTETNFNHYELWFGTNQSHVNSRSGTASEWDNDPNDAGLSTRTTTTTTITGLTAGSTYYALICAVDNYGYEQCSSSLSFVTNQNPTVASVTASPSTTGTGHVTVSFVMDDPDDDNTLQALVEYNVGAGWQKATLSETVSALTATYGTPDAENDNTYQVGNSSGYITSSSGANTVTVVWTSKVDTSTADLSTAQVRVTPYDNVAAGSASSSSNFILDNVAPSGLANFTSSTTTSSAITWTWTASTDTRFDHYEIWYGTNQSDVDSRSGTAIEWDQDNNSALSTATSTNTTITGLSENTTYYAKIFAIDTYLNETTLSAATANNNGLPTLSGLTASQSGNGNGRVTLSFQMNDADANSLQALVEYNIGGGFTKATLLSSVSTTSGTATVTNANAYPIAGVSTASGANIVTVIWDSLTDVSGTDLSTVQIRVRPYDGIETGSTLASSNFTVDHVAPQGLTNFSKSSATSATLSLSWSVATESNFDHYEIWVGTNQSHVDSRSGTAVEWDQDNDSALSLRTTSTTTLTGLSQGTLYYVRLFAVDQKGNEANVVSISARTNSKPTVTSITPQFATNGTGRVQLQFTFSDGDLDGTELLIQYSTDGGVTWTKATLSEVVGDVSVTSGTVPILENDNTRQVGATNGRLSTANGNNTVTVYWLSKTDLASTSSSSILIRAIPYDGFEDGSSFSSSAFTVDNVAPQGFAGFSLDSQGMALVLSWTAVSVEPNFDHYEIWYGTNAFVRGAGAVEYDQDDYATLATMSTSRLEFTAVRANPGFSYTVFMWAVDDYGNETGPLAATLNVGGSVDSTSVTSVTSTSGGGGSGGGSQQTGGTESDSSSEQAEEAASGSSSAQVEEEEAGEEGEVDSDSVQADEEALIGVDAEEVSDVDDVEISEIAETDLVSSTETNNEDPSSNEVAVDSTESIASTDSIEPTESTTDSQTDQGIQIETGGTSSADDAWAETTVKNFVSLDVVQSVHTRFDEVNVSIFDFFFEPHASLTRFQVLEMVLEIFVPSSLTDEGETSEPSTPFSDLYSYDVPKSILLSQGYLHGIINGYEDGSFRGFQFASRAETLKILFLAADFHIVRDFSQGLLSQFDLQQNPFSDVDLKEWYAPYVLYAYQHGFVEGYPDGTFHPDAPVTRAEFSKLVVVLYEEWIR